MGRTAGKDSQGALTGNLGSQSQTLDQGSLRPFSLGAKLPRRLGLLYGLLCCPLSAGRKLFHARAGVGG